MDWWNYKVHFSIWLYFYLTVKKIGGGAKIVILVGTTWKWKLLHFMATTFILAQQSNSFSELFLLRSIIGGQWKGVSSLVNSYSFVGNALKFHKSKIENIFLNWPTEHFIEICCLEILSSRHYFFFSQVQAESCSKLIKRGWIGTSTFSRVSGLLLKYSWCTFCQLCV